MPARAVKDFLDGLRVLVPLGVLCLCGDLDLIGLMAEGAFKWDEEHRGLGKSLGSGLMACSKDERKVSIRTRRYTTAHGRTWVSPRRVLEDAKWVVVHPGGGDAFLPSKNVISQQVNELSGRGIQRTNRSVE